MAKRTEHERPQDTAEERLEEQALSEDEEPEAEAESIAAQEAEAEAEEEQELDPQSLLKELRRTRREAAKWRRKVRELEAVVQAAETEGDSKLKELQEQLDQARAKAEDLEVALREERLKAAVMTSALRLGFRDPADAWQLVDVAAVEYDEAGNPKNLEELLRGLLRQKPYLARVAVTTFESPAPGEQRLTQEELRRQLFGAGGTDFWRGSGIVRPKE